MSPQTDFMAHIKVCFSDLFLSSSEGGNTIFLYSKRGQTRLLKITSKVLPLNWAKMSLMFTNTKFVRKVFLPQLALDFRSHSA